MAFPKCHSCISNRYAISFMCFLGLLISVGYRACFALVATHMTKSKTSSNESSYHSNHSDDSIFPHCTTSNHSIDRQLWDSSTTFLFHTAFFAGQLVASVPAGMLASRFSPKWLFGCTILTTSVLFLILPKTSESSEVGVFIIRTLQGIVEAISVPAMNGFISSVASKTDRARLINIAYGGAYLSPALALFSTGATTCYVDLFSIIYIYGALGCAWCFVWLLLVENNPQKSDQTNERTRLIQPHQLPVVTNHSVQSVPWCKILTSLPMIAIWVASFCRNVIFAMLITEVQQYYKDVYHLSVAMIGLLSALPHIFMFALMMPGSMIFDTLIKKNVLSLTNVRKLAQSLGYGVQGVCFLSIGFVNNHNEALILICVGVGFSAFAISGFQTNPLDLAPQYAGALTGIARTGMVGSVFSTVLASQLTGRSHSLEDWQHMFIIAGSIHLGGVIFYVIFASGNIQPWALNSNSIPHAIYANANNGAIKNNQSVNNPEFDDREKHDLRKNMYEEEVY